MKKTMVLLALLGASSLALANNNANAGKCAALGSVAGHMKLIEDALRVADNREAAMTLAKNQIDAVKKSGKKEVDAELGKEWKAGCVAIGLNMDAYKK
jgi:hypothetical protein